MNIRQIEETIEEGESLRVISQSFSEIASIKLKKIRNDVERTRGFYEEITQVYKLVRKIAALKKINPPSKSKKSICVLLTSNYRFQGSVNNQLIHFFIINTTKMPGTDRLIIGRTGNQYLKSISYFHKFESLIFQKDIPSDKEIKTLVEKIAEYEQVFVFYPQFKTVLVQSPTQKDITQTEAATVTGGEEVNIPTDFIFEPELLKILQFFDNQIKILLLQETFLEAELSRTASRMTSMDQAQTNAKGFIREQHRELAQSIRSLNNNRLQDMINFRSKQKRNTA